MKMNLSTSQYCLENEQGEKEISVKLSSESYEKLNETWKNLSGSDRRENDEIMKLMTNMHVTNVRGGFSNQEVSSSALIDSFFCFKQACRLSKNPLQIEHCCGRTPTSVTQRKRNLSFYVYRFSRFCRSKKKRGRERERVKKKENWEWERECWTSELFPLFIIYNA